MPQPMPGAVPLLEVEELRVDFALGRGPWPAVRGIGFTLQAGESLALLGESGSGKTAALRAIARLLPRTAHVTARRLAFAGLDLLGLPESAMRRIRGRGIGLALQDPLTALDPIMPVGAQVAEAQGGLLPAARQQAAAHWLGRVGLPPWTAGRYPHQLSGGMRQRVLLAMALAADPALLLADEPTASLDPTVAAEILELLQGLRRGGGLSLLLVTHDVAIAARLADRVAVLYAGQVLEAGDAAAVLHRPAHPYTAGLLAATPRRLDGSGPLRPIPGEPPDPLHLPAGCAFAPRCPWVMQACRRQLPPPFAVPGGEGWVSRCWLHDPRAPAATRAAALSWSRPGDAGHSAPWRPAAGATPLLEAVALRRAYRTRDGRLLQALDGVSLVVRPGEVLGLAGESAAGKSTLLWVLGGLLRPDAGTVRFHGADLFAMGEPGRRGLRQRLQPVFQHPDASLDPRLPVEAIVGEGLLRTDRSRRATLVAAALEAVGLSPSLAPCLPSELSGGQRQRVALARALAVEPELLLADEPFAALDASSAAQIALLLQRLLRQRRMACVLAGHDLPLLSRLADRVAVLHAGRLVEVGPAGEVLRSPLHPYTALLRDAVLLPPQAGGAWRRPGAVPPAPAASPQRSVDPAAARRRVHGGGEALTLLGCPFAGRCPRSVSRCLEQPPGWQEPVLGHGVACHFPGEGSADRGRSGGQGLGAAGPP
jgi:peptide/nickel transport system ATP-binding protein